MSLNNGIRPLVSVVMGVHNERREHLQMAIDSICNQTYKDIEFIIVDDCSNEDCKHILSEYSDRYSNIRVIRNDANLGLTKSLNIGIHQASGDYIARMDADDFSVPNRIAKQVEFLIESPEIDLCGTGVISFGDSVMFMSPSNGLTNDEAQCYLFFSSTLCHPSVMIRKSFLSKFNLSYDENVKSGQDYDLWERASIYGKIAVMKDVLLFYRTHSSQITASHKEEQDYYADRTRLRRLSRLSIHPSDKEYLCHKLLNGGVNHSLTIQDVRLWAKRLIDANASIGLVNKNFFSKDLHDRLVLYKLRNHHYLSLISITDLASLIKILFSRIHMRNCLKNEIKRFYNFYENV